MTIKTKDYMKQKLEQILRGSLVIPLTAEQSDGLDKACHEYVEGMDYLLADRLINVFVCDKVDQDLEKEVLDVIVEKLPDVGLVPSIIYKACCMYIVWLAVNSDEMDDETKAGISLMVKNAMLFNKGRRKKVPAPEVMIDFYDIWNEYLQSERPEVDMSASMQTASEVLTEEDFFQTHSIDDVKNRIIRQWAFDSIATTMSTMFEAKRGEYEQERCLMKRMTTAIIDWIMNLPKMSIDTNGIKNIITLFEEDELKQQYPMSQIMDVLSEYEIPLSEDDVLDSSILIKALSNDELSEKIGKIKLSLLEYGIYLYYELVAEKLREE